MSDEPDVQEVIVRCVRAADDGDGTPCIERHQAIHDAIVLIHGDKATIDVRFIVFGAAFAIEQAANSAASGNAQSSSRQAASCVRTANGMTVAGGSRPWHYPGT